MIENRSIILSENHYKIGDVLIVKSGNTNYNIVKIVDILYSINSNIFSFYVKPIFGKFPCKNIMECDVLGKVILKEGVELDRRKNNNK